MSALLTGDQQLAVLGRRKSDWEIMFKTGEDWKFASGSLRQRVIKAAEGQSDPIIIMDSDKDDRFVDTNPPFRSALCISVQVTGRLPVIVFAEDREKIMSFDLHSLPAWEEVVTQLRAILPEMKSPKAAKKAGKKAGAHTPSLSDMFSHALNPEGSDEKVELNWPALIGVLLIMACGFGYMVKTYLQSREEDRLQSCRSNLSIIATAARMYARDNHGQYPKTLEKMAEMKYLDEIPTCPAAGSQTYTDLETNNKPAAVTISCVGGHHRKLFTGSGSPDKFPYYSSIEAAEEVAQKQKRK